MSRLLKTSVIASVTVFFGQCEVTRVVGHHHHHHHHHHGHHEKHHERSIHEQDPNGGNHSTSVTLSEKEMKQPQSKYVASSADVPVLGAADEEEGVSAIVGRMRKLENDLASTELTKSGFVKKSKLQVKGPLPSTFNERFQQAAASAVSCDPAEVRVTDVYPLSRDGNMVELAFDAPVDIAKAINEQATNSESNFSRGDMHEFLVHNVLPENASRNVPEKPRNSLSLAAASVTEDVAQAEPSGEVDIDTEMPYGELEPFGREDTAQELTESSIKESDEMVDQLERAEVAEEKRAVFRALTRLRGAAITSFDGVARSQTGNIDEYNKVHKWRSTHPLRHLASEEADVSKWAFPDNADF
jgi:hypothetical protein